MSRGSGILSLFGFILFLAGPSWAEYDENGFTRLRTTTDKYRVEVTYPQLGLEKIDPVVEKFAKSLYEKSAKDFKDMADEGGFKDTLDFDEMDEENHGSWHSLMDFSATGQTVSFLFSEWHFYPGAAHQSSNYIPLVLDLNGNKLDLPDLFENPSDLLGTASELCKKSVVAKFGEEAATYAPDGFFPDMENFGIFTVKPYGLLFTFKPYQILPWSRGTVDCSIPKEALLPFKPKLDIWTANKPGSSTLDCQKTTKPAEKAICQNPVLSALDNKIVEALSQPVEDEGSKTSSETIDAFRRVLNEACPEGGDKCVLEQFLRKRQELAKLASRD